MLGMLDLRFETGGAEGAQGIAQELTHPTPFRFKLMRRERPPSRRPLAAGCCLRGAFTVPIAAQIATDGDSAYAAPSSS
jgi:hypothetical protein